MRLAGRLLVVGLLVAAPLRAAAAPDLDEALLLAYRGKAAALRGQHREAITLQERALAIAERAAPEHDFVLTVMLGLALTYEEAGDLPRAVTMRQRVIAVRAKRFGPTHDEVIAAITELGVCYHRHGDYARAEQQLERARGMNERAHGAVSDAVAASLGRLGDLALERGDRRRAENLYRRALALAEQLHGPRHLALAAPLADLGKLLYQQGDAAAAERHLARALALSDQFRPKDDPRVLATLVNLATVLAERAELGRAEALLLRALRLTTAVVGPDSPLTATLLNNVAEVQRAKGDYAGAQRMLERALATKERVFGKESSHVAVGLGNLAAVLVARGDLSRAEPLFERALAINEKVFGPNHPSVATALGNLASFYDHAGDYARAEPLLLRGLALREQVLGPRHPDVATSLNNLAALYHSRRETRRARPLAERALAIVERAHGPRHPRVALALNTLGSLLDDLDDPRAERLLRRSAALYEQLLGADHPDTANPRNNLALRLVRLGRYAEAHALLERARATWEARLGPDHPNLATALRNLAAVAAARGQVREALALSERAEAIDERAIRLVLATGADDQKQAFMRSLASYTATAVSFNVVSAPADEAATRLALRMILRRKGRALDAMTDALATLRRGLDPGGRAVLAELAATRAELASLMLAPPARIATADLRARVGALEAAARRLEADVSRRSAAFRAAEAPVTVERVQALIPPGAALVELATFQRVDPRARRTADRRGAPRFVAYVLRRTGAPRFVDLGPVAPIAEDVARLRRALADPQRAEVRALGRALGDRLVAPLRPALGDATQLLISPDGVLHLVPFAALVDRSDRYLVETMTISYLTSGRDLLRLAGAAAAPALAPSAPIVLADPIFDDAALAAGAPPDVRGLRAADLRQLRFAPLAGTAAEARALATLLPGSVVLTGAAATKAALRGVHRPRHLHLATHGFFLPATDAPGGPNPLVRSGLALAGANLRRGADPGAGLLTALEAAGLDLDGTRLVVLSACETGVGDVRTGDGVYGLRRALVLAGAQSQLMSLWKVSDEATRDLMIAYYGALRAGRPRSAALREVQRRFAAGGPRSHPFYWAGFIPIGDWRALD